LKKDRKGFGKQPFTATLPEGGRTQSTLDHQIKINATTFKEAKIKAIKKLRKLRNERMINDFLPFIIF
jgi:hypothetical protein